MFEGQPKGLWTLALANTGERFGYYTMLAVFALFLGENFGFAAGTASEIYTWFLTAVYFLPLIGGMAADRWGYSKMVVIGILIMFLGYLLLSVPLGGGTVAIAAMGAALLLVSLGTGLFKGNLQVMVGDLYNAPEFADKRDSGFSLFYMAINVGALFAPTAAIKIMDWAQTSLGYSKADGVRILCEALGIGTDEVVVFGDGGNDLEMLGAVENSVAVANATPEVLAAARWHIGSCADEAVADVMLALAAGEWPFEE